MTIAYEGKPGDQGKYDRIEYCDVCGRRVEKLEMEKCCSPCWSWGLLLAERFNQFGAYWPI